MSQTVLYKTFTIRGGDTSRTAAFCERIYRQAADHVLGFGGQSSGNYTLKVVEEASGLVITVVNRWLDCILDSFNPSVLMILNDNDVYLWGDLRQLTPDQLTAFGLDADVVADITRRLIAKDLWQESDLTEPMVVNDPSNPHANEPLTDLDASASLNAHGYHTWGDLGKLTRAELATINCLSRKEREKIARALIKKGFWKERALNKA